MSAEGHAGAGEVEDIARVIGEATKDHYRTSGMNTSGPGTTCECSYSTETEDPPQNSVRGPGLGGRDQLGWHRSVVAARALLDAGMTRVVDGHVLTRCKVCGEGIKLKVTESAPLWEMTKPHELYNPFRCPKRLAMAAMYGPGMNHIPEFK